MIFLANIDLSQNELRNCVLQPLATPPPSPRLGQIYCNSVTSKIMWYTGQKWQTVGVVVESSETNGNIIVDGVEMSVYTLPIASPTVLGGIKVGAGLTIDANGVLSTTGGGVADSVAWENVVGRPTSLSSFTNDEGFIDNTVSNLLNYYTKAGTYSKAEVNSLIEGITFLNILKVDELPVTNISTTTIYLVPKNPAEANNIYNEYIYVNAAWEIIGDTEVDLSNYLAVNGDASSTIVSFDIAENLDLPVSGENQSVIIGKIVKNLSELSLVALTGDYRDLNHIPDTVRQVIETITDSSHVIHIDGKLAGISITDSITGEAVIVDYTVVKDNTYGQYRIDFLLSQVPTNPLNAVITYVYSEGGIPY